MNILAIDTSCDETAVSIVANAKSVSNSIWSQASLHSSFGGVFPSLAQRQHKERIDWVIKRSITTAGLDIKDIDAFAVTIGPGLAVALGVGIDKARELAIKYKKPLIPINHIEGHLLSPLINSNLDITFPALGLVLSGGTTMICLIKDIGNYELLAETSDDALGEALDKGARLLGLGYPGGAILEKFAKKGDSQKYSLPLPLQSDVVRDRFSYSGLKTAFVRLFSSIESPSSKDIEDLSATFQSTAFAHVEKVLEYQISNLKKKYPIHDLLFGGGVANNVELKKRLRKLCKKYDIKLHVPYNKKLNGDNAAMIGFCTYLKYGNSDLKQFLNYDEVDRKPRLKL
jgi:N6-L-threonylcarbamoyladenine synthase